MDHTTYPQERWSGLPSRQREEIPAPSICWASYSLANKPADVLLAISPLFSFTLSDV